MKYLLLDVAGTILHKPDLFTNISNVLNKNGYNVPLSQLKISHKILSETIKFPDRTNSDFYAQFNSELLYAIGVLPTGDLIQEIFDACTYLPWQKFADTEVLKDVKIPIGILSNFNSSLKQKLDQYFGSIFTNVFVSEEIGYAKPSLEFYTMALNEIGLPPEDILYIGDSFKLDLKPALTLGMNAYIIDRDNFYPTNKHCISSFFNLASLLG